MFEINVPVCDLDYPLEDYTLWVDLKGTIVLYCVEEVVFCDSLDVVEPCVLWVALVNWGYSTCFSGALVILEKLFPGELVVVVVVVLVVLVVTGILLEVCVVWVVLVVCPAICEAVCLTWSIGLNNLARF